ncbi:hypothetical protein EVAR_22894_1 [Eumeta japonica]|uniref:Uncharacterized protein n=1 Tax=Eumeta variegata TaxID=151549 RepID=A0A4C1UW20_EUMVA|nr:hypothetical protein EVAR_22894_1 [Eumeta japonica]
MAELEPPVRMPLRLHENVGLIIISLYKKNAKTSHIGSKDLLPIDDKSLNEIETPADGARLAHAHGLKTYGEETGPARRRVSIPDTLYLSADGLSMKNLCGIFDGRCG